MQTLWLETKTTVLALLPYALILWLASSWWTQQRADWRAHLDRLEAQSQRQQTLLLGIQATLDQKGLIVAGRPFRPAED